MDHIMDLDAHETTRLACVLDAIGDTYDPATVALDEARATRMLYSGLDPDQELILLQLRDAGVLG